MTNDRVAQLEELGFSWEVRPGLERPRATWQQRYDELKLFHKQHGNFLVAADVDSELHSWCQEQRQRLKNLDRHQEDKSKRMGPDRVKALADLGFTKDVELADSPLSSNVKDDTDGGHFEMAKGGDDAKMPAKKRKVSTTYNNKKKKQKVVEEKKVGAVANV